MSEAQQSGFMIEPQQNRQEAPAEPEPQLPDNWENLFETNTPQEEPQEEPQQPQQGGEATEEPQSAPESNAAELEAEVAKWRAWGANLLRQQANTQQTQDNTQQDPIEAALNKVKEQYTGVDDGVMTFMRDVLKEVLPAVQAPIQQQVSTLAHAQQSLQNRGVLEEFDNHLGQLFDAKGLPKSLHRQFKNDIYMEGHRRYGNTFDESKASRLFNEAYNEFAKESHAQNESYVNSKVDKTNNSPPPTHRGSGGHAVEDVHKQIIDSRKKENDFGGKNWRKMVLKKLGREA
jgi:hypothetical protein